MTDTTEMFGRLHGQPMWQMSQSMPIRRRRGSWEAFRLLHIITQYLGAKRHLQIASVMWKELACFHHDSSTINFFFFTYELLFYQIPSYFDILVESSLPNTWFLIITPDEISLNMSSLGWRRGRSARNRRAQVPYQSLISYENQLFLSKIFF